MRRARIILTLGIWIALLPYTGFPTSWKNVLFTITGLVLAYLSYIMYKESRVKTDKTFENFSENKDFDGVR